MINRLRFIGALAALLLIVGTCVAADKPWPPVDGVPMTTWGKGIAAGAQPWPEYPRPQLVRDRWLNLNGSWDYALVAKDAAQPAAFDGKILVPFPPQSVLSQVNKAVSPDQRIWYHRTFTIPATWSGQRVLLHFGAVNWQTEVLVNGKSVGTHTGGYDGFTFDITDFLTSSGEQQVTLSAWNPVEGGQPRGKQSLRPGGIFYTPTTGIWQTVWLEPVPATNIAKLIITPNVDASSLDITVNANATSACNVRLVVLDQGKEVAHATGKPGILIPVKIENPKLWWPESPFLYDLSVVLTDAQGATIDTVTSYAGMRKISLGPDASGRTHMLLNNTFIFELGFLDQGFWPDGIYTAPSDKAQRNDFETTKLLGFNMLRKHIKVEPDRWYYWADKLGIMIWQDMPSSTEMGFNPSKKYIPDIEGNFESELRRMVEGRYNHPSIIVWVPFNEGWGLSLADKKVHNEKDSMNDATRAREARMVKALREEDSSRLINAESGAGGGGNQGANFWDAGLGDIIDYHCYGGDAPEPEAHRASVIGEAGWGVGIGSSLAGRLKTAPTLGESALVITQLTDVENETNGALTYDRATKFKLEAEGANVIDMMHKAGYLNYPGHAPAAAAGAPR